MPNRFAWIYKLYPVDLLIIVFTNLLSLIVIILAHNGEAILLVPINLIAAVGIGYIAGSVKKSESKFLQKFHDWYPVPAIFFIFKEVHIVIQSLGRHDWDNLFIAIDRAIFGVDPTVWIAKLSTPVLTEILQIAYASYYFIMLAVGIELYLRKDYRNFSFAVFAIVYGFVLSYIGYLLFPAVGPRFTLHNFSTINADLPGLWCTNFIREMLNAGESIPPGSMNAIALAQRDVFPSGHTQMTIISLILAHRYQIKSRYILYVLGILLILSTVYLRYHYVIDLAGGVLFVWLTLWSAPKLIEWWGKLEIKK